MSRPVEIEYIAQVAQYLRETKKAAVTTDDLAEALVATSSSGDELERKLSKAMRDAEKDVDALDRAVRDLPKATDHAADEADKDFGRMGDDAKDAGKEAGSSFAGSLGEGLSSGDTSEVFQEVLGEAVSNINGPVSAAVAAGAALALAVWNSFKGESEKSKEMLNEYLDLTDEVTGQIDKLEALRTGITELGGGDWGQGMKDIAEYSRITGVSIEDLARVVAGEVNPAAQRTRDLLKEQYDLGYAGQENYNEQKIALGEILRTSELTVTATEEAATATDNWNSIAKRTHGYLHDSTLEVDILADKIKRLPQDLVLKVKVDDKSLGQFSGGAYATSGGASGGAIYKPRSGASG